MLACANCHLNWFNQQTPQSRKVIVSASFKDNPWIIKQGVEECGGDHCKEAVMSDDG